MHIAATYFNIVDVEKISYATSKQAPNQTLKVKRNVVPKPSCGS
jgi:hypothetical protein